MLSCAFAKVKEKNKSTCTQKARGEKISKYGEGDLDTYD